MMEQLPCILIPIFHCDAKPFALGPRVGLDPQRHNFALGIPTLKFALPPTGTLNASSQWTIGCVGSPGVGARVGHVHFMLFVTFHVRWVANANTVFSGIWALMLRKDLTRRSVKICLENNSLDDINVAERCLWR